MGLASPSGEASGRQKVEGLRVVVLLVVRRVVVLLIVEVGRAVVALQV